MKKNIVYVILLGNMNLGSSRIIYRTLNFLLNCFETKVVGYDNDLKCDILFIQKDTSLKSIDLARKAHLMGIPVVFDEDDDIEKISEEKMFQYVCSITVDTEARRRYVQSKTNVPVFVVPRTIDYLESSDVFVKIREVISSIVTFGHEKSLLCAKSYLEKIKDKYLLNQIGSRNMNGWAFTKWSLNTFIDELIRNDICFLAHSEDDVGNRKSPARLITTMAVGLPTIVSNTSSFREIMKSVGHPELIAESFLNFIERDCF